MKPTCAILGILVWDPARDGLDAAAVDRAQTNGRTCRDCLFSRPSTLCPDGLAGYPILDCLRYRDRRTPYHGLQQRQCWPSSTCLGWTSPKERMAVDHSDPEQDALQRAEETAIWPDLTRAPT